jgi:hypothetical protein
VYFEDKGWFVLHDFGKYYVDLRLGKTIAGNDTESRLLYQNKLSNDTESRIGLPKYVK